MSFNKHEFKDKGIDGVAERILWDAELYGCDQLETLNWLMIGTEVLAYENLNQRFHIMQFHRPYRKERWKPGKKPKSFQDLSSQTAEEMLMTFDFKVSRLIYRLGIKVKARDMFTFTAHAISRNDREIYLGGPDAKSIREATENALFSIERLIFKGHG